MTTLIDLSTIPLSATTVPSAGTVRWMSPELLRDQNPPPTYDSDRYALGMVVYEVSWSRSSRRPSAYPPPGPDWPPTIPFPRSLRSGDRRGERRASKETR